jgi:hypothetical protein
VHVVGAPGAGVALRIRHSVVGEDPLVAGSISWNAAAPEAAACVTMNACPAIVTVPILAGPGLSGTAMNTLPLPDPLAPERIVMNGVVVLAVQAQLDPVVTPIDAVALVLLMLSVVGEIA